MRALWSDWLVVKCMDIIKRWDEPHKEYRSRLRRKRTCHWHVVSFLWKLSIYICNWVFFAVFSWPEINPENVMPSDEDAKENLETQTETVASTCAHFPQLISPRDRFFTELELLFGLSVGYNSIKLLFWRLPSLIHPRSFVFVACNRECFELDQSHWSWCCCDRQNPWFTTHRGEPWDLDFWGALELDDEGES